MYVIIYSLNLLLFHVVVVCFYGCYNLSSSTTKKNVFLSDLWCFGRFFFFSRWKLKKDGNLNNIIRIMSRALSLSWDESCCGKDWHRFLCWYIGWYEGRIYYTLTIVVANNIDVLCFYIFSVLTSDYTVWLDCWLFILQYCRPEFPALLDCQSTL